MKKLSVLVLLFCGLSASAQELHTFSNGEVADAEKINQNFDSLEASLPPSNCSKIRSFDGMALRGNVLRTSWQT